MEQLTPEQSEDFERAKSLAWGARATYDEMTVAARAMSGLEHPIDEARTVEQFDNNSTKFDRLMRAANLLMPSRSAFEAPEPIEPFASEAVWALMSNEQKVKADDLRAAIAEQFAEYGVTTDSLRVVMHDAEDGEKTFTLLHTGNGIDIGDHTKDYDKARSYNSVMSKKNDELFTITVDGQKYDTRKGMTDAAYDALYDDALKRGVTLPDSILMAEEAGDIPTWTMLTGESPTVSGNVQFRCVVGGGGVRQEVASPDFGYRNRRVRLAVVL